MPSQHTAFATVVAPDRGPAHHMCEPCPYPTRVPRLFTGVMAASATPIYRPVRSTTTGGRCAHVHRHCPAPPACTAALMPARVLPGARCSSNTMRKMSQEFWGAATWSTRSCRTWPVRARHAVQERRRSSGRWAKGWNQYGKHPYCPNTIIVTDSIAYCQYLNH